MPNWVYTDYYVIGTKEQLDQLYSIMKELEERDESLVENGFGKTWLGNLVARLGGDPDEIYCRGKWTMATLSDCLLSFSVESAWEETEETRHFIEQCFPGIKIYFQSVGDGFWTTNDRTGKYSARYYLVTDEEGEDYFTDLSELIVEVERITGVSRLRTLDDCEQALERHSEANDESAFDIGEFEIVD